MSEQKTLTLEELRQMDGKPVWVHVVDHTVFADKEDDFDGYGLVRKSWVRVWDEKRADLIHVDYDFCGYGKEWLAYADEPRHLNRSAWKPCESCEDYSVKYCGNCENLGNPVYRDPCKSCCFANKWAPKNNFCSACGRPLNDAAWDMLEKRLDIEK